MRDITGWVGGALGVAALVGAFYVGGRVTAAGTDATAMTPATPAVAASPAVDGFEFSCAAGQRVVMRDATATTPRSAACVGEPAAAAAPAAAPVAGPVVAPAGVPLAIPVAQRTVVTEPLEVYRPRSVPVSYPSERDARQPVRTKTKSAVIIGSSTAIGATIGGLTKGTKGAIVGGIIGGGAATVWDQVTRRQGSSR
ncbi:MAG: hypothetical protein AB7U83_14630 [Vicinamibacterales bacterium]